MKIPRSSLKLKDYKNTSFHDPDQIEKDFEGYETFVESQKIEENELRKSPKSSFTKHFLLVALIMMSEYIIFQKVAYGVIKFDLLESCIVALVILGIAKLLAIYFKPKVFHWIKSPDKKTKSSSKLLLKGTSILIVLNLLALGSLNVFSVNRNINLEKIATLQTQIANAENNDLDASMYETELQEKLEDQNNGNPFWIKLLIYFAVALLSLLSVISASINYCYAVYFKKSIDYDKELKGIEGAIEKTEADLDYINETRIRIDSDLSATKNALITKDKLEERISKKHTDHNSLTENLKA